jgi:ribosome-associated toxin RatA of RatAB toxin-antitoxin module
MASKVSKEMVVDVSVERFWEVVAAYEAYPGFVPSVKKTRVVRTD